MKTVFKLILIILILMLSGVAFGADYTVSQTGSGADYSITQFNSLTGDHGGDTFYFKGTITSTIDPKIYGNSGSQVVLDGYQAGDFDPWGGGTSNAILSGSAQFLLRRNNDYVTVQDFRMTGGPSTTIFIINYYSASYPDRSDHVLVQRNYLYDSNASLFASTINLSGQGSDYITVKNNRFSRYARTSSNTASGVNFYNVSNLLFESNEIENDSSAVDGSANNIELHTCSNALIQYNDSHDAYHQAAGIAIKEPNPGNQNIIVRFNKFHDNGDKGIAVGWLAQYIYIYGNDIYNNGDGGASRGFGMDVKDGANYVYIWSNLIRESGHCGAYLWYRTGVTGDPHTNHIYFYNNTFARNGRDATGTSYSYYTGIFFSDSSGSNYYVKNNIFYQNRPNASTYPQVYVTSGLGDDINLESNTYYYPLKTATIYYDSGYRTISTLQSSYSLEAASPAGEVADPGFSNPSQNDYTLSGSRINNGKNLSQCFDVSVQGKNYHICLDDALDPANTEWTTTPPTVKTVKQGDYGVWDRGAYAYTGASKMMGAPPAPTITIQP